ncbi:uncharacterized protein LOC106441183 isoform X2 [Brassica napus]|uniref:uncharacterized protein LOC106441183 isoform X2 n=1 Tax=Brassica napus TaxID=3708 RepID=UPI00207A1042|nr:uncharacterized protein LOC106441183 isoform X2 [Brassica napus]
MVLLDEKDPSPHISLTLSRSIEGSINRDIDFRMFLVRETTVYVSIIYLIANLLHERAQEGLSSASAKYGRIKKLEYVALSECNNTNAHHLLISHTRVVRTIQMMI